MAVRDNDRTKEVIRNINLLERGYVVIGVIGNDKHKNDDEMTVLGIANIHEFGYIGLDKNGNKVNIPERSFIRASFDGAVKDLDKFIPYVDMAVRGELSAEALYHAIGNECVSYIQEYIRNLKEPPNAPSTIKQKGSSSPLIDTGQLLDSITYEVRFD